MVIPLKVRIKRNGIDEAATAKRLGRSTWNELMRAALTAAAMYWTQHFLPRKFSRDAKQRYRLESRSYGYEAKKRRFEQQGLRPIRIGRVVRINRGGGFTAQPLVFTGAMRDQLTSQSYKARATATSTRQKVRVPVPLGHPVPLYVAAEIQRLRPDEQNELHRFAFRRLVDALAEYSLDQFGD